MPRQNRVTPFSTTITTSARGRWLGNRGCIHDDLGHIRRLYQTRRWIICQLQYKGRRRNLMQPGRWTELFFLDEATAFAAGHRPCALCRRADYDRFGVLWAQLHDGERGADAIDARLHNERLTDGGRAQRHHDAALDDLPDGAFVLRDGAPWLVRGDALLRWSPGGYEGWIARPAREGAVVITPPSLVAVLRAGWHGDDDVPLLHPTAARYAVM